jgi:nucleotide-binding universal stress UspA family protein
MDQLELIAGKLQHAGATVLAEAARTLEQLMPEGQTVSTELCHGAVASSLIETSTHACLLVLHQRDGHRHLQSTIHAVTARAQCPVTVVPHVWRGEGSTEPRWVVAGVEDASRSARVVRDGLAEASRRHARLRLVHGVDDQAERTDQMDAGARDAWMRLKQRALQVDLTDLRAGRPDVAVEVEVVFQTPAAAVVGRSQDAVLVVLGRGHGRVPAIRRPGPVTAEVLSRAACPVMVVDDEPPGPVPRPRSLAEMAVP